MLTHLLCLCELLVFGFVFPHFIVVFLLSLLSRLLEQTGAACAEQADAELRETKQ